ncbi:MAG: hypothetical protein CFE23_11820 [Flavobacterium sp. BFFFF1]|uniref:DUF2256 domain-containing protein n=1 Tax=Flavobacterium sp. BFFFF1 TaxID=2015557 RepID=UPI000BD52A18|nr:MAG: hypothetical protein CFE23_11820 [Flavobacterium sp. BFFFF1]
MPHKKSNLPTKTCPVCGRPFSWRKKWEKVWDEVKYCNDWYREPDVLHFAPIYITFRLLTYIAPYETP